MRIFFLLLEQDLGILSTPGHFYDFGCDLLGYQDSVLNPQTCLKTGFSSFPLFVGHLSHKWLTEKINEH